MTLAAFQGPCPVCHRDSDLTQSTFDYMHYMQGIINQLNEKLVAMEAEAQEMRLQALSDFTQYMEWTEERSELLRRIAELEAK